MLTIGDPMGAVQVQTYHQVQFGGAQESYYSEGDHVKGQWRGRLAEEWKLTGEVNQEHFARLAQGQHPFTGEQLVRHQTAREYLNALGERVRTVEHRAAWDLTFSAPKSVSLTALVGGDARVREEYRACVDIALSETERFVQARMGGNNPAITTGRWVVATFEHDSSRPVAGYAAPQLHTHCVVFNVTVLDNGQARALQPQELFRAQQYATAVFRSELALRLQRLGYEIEVARTGAPEIKGYSRAYLEASSPRRAQIQEHLERHGFTGAGAAQIAAHQTRDAKLTLSREEVRQQHRELAAAHGHQPERVVREASQRTQIAIDPAERGRAVDSAMAYARDRNIERDAVALERELMKDALKRSIGQASLEDVRAQLEQRVSAGELVQVESRRPDRAFTTPQMQSAERGVIEAMRAGQGQYEALVGADTRRQIAQSHAHLSTSQHAAVDQVLANRDRIMALDGVAGAGKTTSLTAIRDAAERDGYVVRGMAPTSGATRKLEEAGIRSTTLQHHLARGEAVVDGARHLYVVDESSLASTKQVQEFVRRLEPQDRVLLVGDTRQHQAIDAGRPYQQLQEAGMQTARLSEIVRQKDPVLKEAVEQLARGQVRDAVLNLDAQGRVHEIPDPQARLEAIAREYVKDPQRTLIVSPDNESRHAINQLVHRERQQAGQVAGDERTLRVLVPRQDMTGADRAWVGQYEVGDVVRYTKGSQTVGINAGEYARVAAIDKERNLITVERDGGRAATYDPRRLQGVAVYRETERQISLGDRVQFTAPSKDLAVANRELGTVERLERNGDVRIRLESGRAVDFNVKQHPHLDHGYAMTSHSAQGQTAGRVLVNVDTDKGAQLVNNRMAYVAISRGSHDVQIFTSDKTSLGHQLGRDLSRASAIGQEVGKAMAKGVSQAVEASNVATAAIGGGLKVAKVVAAKVREMSQDQGQGIE